VAVSKEESLVDVQNVVIIVARFIWPK